MKYHFLLMTNHLIECRLKNSGAFLVVSIIVMKKQMKLSIR